MFTRSRGIFSSYLVSRQHPMLFFLEPSKKQPSLTNPSVASLSLVALSTLDLLHALPSYVNINYIDL